MYSKFMKLDFLLLAGALALFGSAAHAQDIRTSGVICQNANSGQAQDIDYLLNGARNLNSSRRSIICAVPRPGNNEEGFSDVVVEGQNFPRTTTSCTVTLYNFDGISQMVSFSVSAFSTILTWARNVTFPPGTVHSFDYASVVCSLPGNGGGIINGVAWVR